MLKAQSDCVSLHDSSRSSWLDPSFGSGRRPGCGSMWLRNPQLLPVIRISLLKSGVNQCESVSLRKNWTVYAGFCMLLGMEPAKSSESGTVRPLTATGAMSMIWKINLNYPLETGLSGEALSNAVNWRISCLILDGTF